MWALWFLVSSPGFECLPRSPRSMSGMVDHLIALYIAASKCRTSVLCLMPLQTRRSKALRAFVDSLACSFVVEKTLNGTLPGPAPLPRPTRNLQPCIYNIIDSCILLSFHPIDHYLTYTMARSLVFPAGGSPHACRQFTRNAPRACRCANEGPVIEHSKPICFMVSVPFFHFYPCPACFSYDAISTASLLVSFDIGGCSTAWHIRAWK